MAVTYDGLIESDWNLKEIKERFYEHSSKGLIESDWNLKRHTVFSNAGGRSGLIESDWNLKYVWTTLQVLYIQD